MALLKFRAWDAKTQSFTMFENKLPAHTANIMQMVGIKDASKQDVYEGDICKGNINIACVNKEMVGEVVYNQSNGRYELKNSESAVSLHIVTSLNVIGNIHQNADLLEPLEASA